MLYEDYPIILFVVILFVLMRAGMAGYLVAAYDTARLDERWRGKLVEAMNYASQTITTVGYGNIDPGLGHHRGYQQRIRFLSSFYTLVGAIGWALLIELLFGRRT